jgi:hypothetical protein
MMDYEKVYIYALIDPCTDDIRYIGKSIDPEQRYSQHLNNKDSNKLKIAWINRLGNNGLQPKMKILEIANEKNWQDRECWWIERGREFGWKLFNITPGGENSVYQLPVSFYQVLEPDLLMKLEELPSRKQVDIIVKVAKKIADYFQSMVQAMIVKNEAAYWRIKDEATGVAIKEISRLVSAEVGV